MSLVLLWVDSSGKPHVCVLRGSLRVGRSMEADVRLTDPSVAPLHATIDAGGSPPVVTATGPLWVNGRPVTTWALREGDVLQFGRAEATVADAAHDAAGPDPAAAAVSGRHAAPPAAPAHGAPDAGAPFPFLRVTLVTLLILGGAWAINSARSVKWSAKLDPEDARIAERQARGINALLGRTTPEATRPLPAAERTRFGAVTAVPPAPSPGENLLNVALRSVVSITGNVRIDGRRTQIIGSGFFVTTTGLIVTNAHVMDHEGTYLGRTYDGRYLTLTDRERSRELDLGLMAAIGEGPFPALAFGRAKGMNYGDQVWAIGSPLAAELGFSVTRGIVSSPLRLMNGRAFLQHDAAINPGNSGGPLVDTQGRLVGVNTWKIAGETQGLGFAIPVEVLEEVLRTWKVKL